jgi:hypothetical protein
MANDIRALLRYLGIEKGSMIGHDRAARVGTFTELGVEISSAFFPATIALVITWFT